MLRQLFKFHGGIKPPAYKADSTQQPIRTAPLPAKLIIPLHQHVGGTPRPIVEIGQHVLKYQRLGEADGELSAAVHAPTSGTIVDVGPYVMAHPSGLTTLCVVLIPDGKEETGILSPFDWEHESPQSTQAYLRDMGIVGMGGAVFPSHAKLKGATHGLKTLVVNGAECEPFITCDDRLMREHADQIVAGAQIMQQLMKAERVLIGIEDNKPEAIAALKKACAQRASIETVTIQTRYPAGGAKQLIRVLTGIEVPHGTRSTDFGVQCFNVATARAIWQALTQGIPLVRRIVTVSGNVSSPGNWEVAIGTPMADLLALAGVKEPVETLIMGGPMMGVPMPDKNVPVVKATNCIIAADRHLFPPPPPEQACIRCGDCAQVCPADLQPFEMYWHSRSKNFAKAQAYHIFDCIECGCCAYVCPSHIRLVDYYRFAKSEIWAQTREITASNNARERFEWRNARQEREKTEKAAKLAAKAAQTRETLTAHAEASPASSAMHDKQALIAAALARAQQQKASMAAQNTGVAPPSSPLSAPNPNTPSPSANDTTHD